MFNSILNPPRQTLTWPHLPLAGSETWGHRRLDQILDTSPELLIDNASKIIFFSDIHRSDKSVDDEFAFNEALFLHALSRYYHAGFTYIELGDGDDLWQTPDFSRIERAYTEIFTLLRGFKAQNRLHMIVGNHEIQGQQYQHIEKGEFSADEGLVLRHRHGGQRLLVVHGHQVDVWSDQLGWLSQELVWLMHRGSNRLGLKVGDLAAPAGLVSRRLNGWYKNSQQRIALQLTEWAKSRQEPIITGHTHLPVFPQYYQTPYFNTGCGINPGYITGIEIENGLIFPVKWFKAGMKRYERVQLAPALPFERISSLLGKKLLLRST